MPGKTTASLSPEVERRIAEIGRMTLTEVQGVRMALASAKARGLFRQPRRAS